MKMWFKNFTLRLIDLASLSITAYLLLYLLLRTGILDVPLLFLSETFNSLPPLIAYTFLFIVGFSLPLFLKKHNCYNITHTIKNDLRHPPAYLASFFVIAFSLYTHDLSELIDVPYAILFSAGTFLCLLMMLTKQSSKPEKESYDKSQNFDIKLWLEKEIPIANKNYDFTNLTAYAKRITTLLEKSKKSHQVAIRGEFGSGKSSLCKLIEEQLTTQGKKAYIFSYIDGWGRDHDSHAGQILEIIVEELSQYVDSSALSSIPENYINALNNSGFTGASSISHILGTNSKANPKNHLEKIDNLLKSIDKHMVIVLEDFDRSCEQEKTINSLAALLERIKELERINFILCIKATQDSILEKICTHIEDIPDIQHVHSQIIIEKFIELIENEIGSETIYIKQNYFFVKEFNPLIGTPRTLKQALRRTYSAWNNIKGEIHLFDLLHLNILRFCSPSAFIFFLNSFTTLQNIEKSKNNAETQKLKQKLAANLKSAIKLESDLQPAKVLIGSLFDHDIFDSDTATQRSAALAIYRHNTREQASDLQRIKNDRGSNYFIRAITESLNTNEAMDQKILKALYSKQPSKESIKILGDAKNKAQYGNYLKNLVDWTFATTSFDDELCQHLTNTLNSEITRNAKNNTSLYFEPRTTLDGRNKKNKEIIYLTCESIAKIFNFMDAANTNNTILTTKRKILEHLIKSNFSIAVEMIQYTYYFYAPEMKFQLCSLLFENIEENDNYDIFQSADRTDTKLIDDLFECHKEISRKTTTEEELDEFHKTLSKQSGIYKDHLTPMLLLHFDKNKHGLYKPLTKHWKVAELRRMLNDFKFDNTITYQYKNEIENLLVEWREYANHDFHPLKPKVTDQ